MPDKWRCVCGTASSPGDRVDWLLWKKRHKDCLAKAAERERQEKSDA